MDGLIRNKFVNMMEKFNLYEKKVEDGKAYHF